MYEAFKYFCRTIVKLSEGIRAGRIRLLLVLPGADGVDRGQEDVRAQRVSTRGHRDRERARRHPGTRHLNAGTEEVQVRVLDGRKRHREGKRLGLVR